VYWTFDDLGVRADSSNGLIAAYQVAQVRDVGRPSAYLESHKGTCQEKYSGQIK